MMINEAGSIWWDKLYSSSSMMDELIDNVLAGQNQSVGLADRLPWKMQLIDEICTSIKEQEGMRLIKQFDGSQIPDPFQFILDEFVEKDARRKYRPIMKPGEFLANADHTNFHDSILIIDSLSPDQASQWKTIIQDYDQSRKQGHKTTVLLFENGPELPASFKSFKTRLLSDYTNEFDNEAFCSVMTAAKRGNESLKPYLRQLALELSNQNPELAARLIDQREDFLKDPETVCAKQETELFGKEIQNPEERKQAVWKAQVKILLPEVEEYRTNFIKKYEDKIGKILVYDHDYQDLETAQDAEIGNLWHMIYNHKFEVSDFYSSTIDAFKDARNALAHITPVSYELAKKVIETSTY